MSHQNTCPAWLCVTFLLELISEPQSCVSLWHSVPSGSGGWSWNKRTHSQRAGGFFTAEYCQYPVTPLHMLCLYVPECSYCSHCLMTICLCTPEAKQRPYYADYSPLRLSIHALCTSHYLDLFITIIICINVFTMSIEHYNQPQVSLTVQREPFHALVTHAHDFLVCVFCSI